MFRSLIFTAAVLAAAPAFAQDPHGAHAGMQPAAGAMPASHAMPVTTSPADGAMLMAAPDAFTITFPHPMRLTRVSIAAQGGETVEASVPADGEAAATARVALPTLTPGTYTLTWTAAMGDHEMSDTVGFMVH